VVTPGRNPYTRPELNVFRHVSRSQQSSECPQRTAATVSIFIDASDPPPPPFRGRSSRTT
jgi:hypothetical protein